MVYCIFGLCFISQGELIFYIVLAAIVGLIIGALCGYAFESGRKKVVYVQPPPQYPPQQHRQPVQQVIEEQNKKEKEAKE